MEALNISIALGMIERRKYRLCSNVESQTNCLPNYSGMFISTDKAAFVIYLQIFCNAQLLPDVNRIAIDT